MPTLLHGRPAGWLSWWRTAAIIPLCLLLLLLLLRLLLLLLPNVCTASRCSLLPDALFAGLKRPPCNLPKPSRQPYPCRAHLS
jgi:hypothetical protein